MERQSKITKRLVDSLKADGTDYYVFDRELIGFGIRVRKTGGMSYVVRYRAGSGRNAPVRRVTIAPVGKVTPDEARAAARDILASVVKGADPARAKTDEKRELTFADLVDRYLVEVTATKKPKTLELYTHVLKAYATPALGAKKARAVSTPDIGQLRISLSGKPVIANRTCNVISSMYGWADKSGILPDVDNPTVGVERYKEGRRERYLSSDELARLGAAIEEAETVGIPWEPDPEKKIKHAPKAVNRRLKIDAFAAAALRLYLLTGARLREILRLKWHEVDLERGILLLPDSKTGSKTIILNAPARLLLSSLPRAGLYVIPGAPKKADARGKIDEQPRHDLKRPWHRVRQRAGLDGLDGTIRVRVHDLRHTHASVGVGASFGLPIVGKLLGHVQARTTERYAHLETDPLRNASEAIGQRIADAMANRKPDTDNVVPLKVKR